MRLSEFDKATCQLSFKVGRMMTNQILANVNVPTVDRHILLPIQTSRPLYVFGRNGSGKSSLVHHIVQQLPRSIYIPGSRPSYFDNDSLHLTPATRRQMEDSWVSWDRQPQTRYRPINGTQRNERAILDLQQAETQFKVDAANEIKAQGETSSAIRRLQTATSPFDRVNTLLRQANLPVSILMQDGELVARRDGGAYSIARMSDGERTALVLAAEIVCAPSASIFVIDEPELHLHKSIVVPLIAALIAERTDCAFVISTHELELPSHSLTGSAVITRGCQWNGDLVRSWQADYVTELGEVPENLRVDVLGSRTRIVFVEGEESSLDQPFYALLFPNVSVRARNSAREVKEAVRSLNQIFSIHHAEPFGIIDNDGLDKDEISALKQENIFPLSYGTIESFYYGEECLRAVAAVQSQTFGTEAVELFSAANAAALACLDNDQTKTHLALRVAEQSLRNEILKQIPTRAELQNPKSAEVAIQLSSLYSDARSNLDQHIRDEDIKSIIARFPIRETRLLDTIAINLKFRGRRDYEAAVLARIANDESLRNALRAKLGDLSDKL